MNEVPKKKSGVKKFLLGAVSLLLLGFMGFMMFAYYASYSEGVRSGFVIKVSSKGLMFKTREGEMNVQTFGSKKTGESPVSETFVFSVFKNADDVYKDLEAVSLSGERVNLHYQEKYVHLPWRGETTYFVTKVERSNRPTDATPPSAAGGDPLHPAREAAAAAEH